MRTTVHPGRRATTRSAIASAKWRGDEVVDADGQVRAVLLEGAHADDRERPVSVERVERRRRELLEAEDAHRSRSRLSEAPTGRLRAAAVHGGAADLDGRPAAAMGRGLADPALPCAASRVARKSALARSSAVPGSPGARPGAAPPPGGGSGEDGEARPRAEPVEAAEVVVGQEAAQGQRDRERERPARSRERARRARSRAPSRGGRRRRSRADGSSRSPSPSGRTRGRASAG